MQDYYISDFVKVVFLSPNDDSYWFGYYNYCPISFDGERLLAHRFLCEEEKDFEQEDVIEIGWFSLEDHSWHKVATTHAANWQQGAMAQWLLDDGQECIIFNDADGDKYVSKIATQNGVIKRQLPCGIYGINHNQAFSITLNFERAYWCRTYHYQYIRKDCYDVSTCEVDGIYKLDISTGKLNDVLASATARVQPPTDKGKRLKIYYMTQASTRPPTFVCFVNDKELFHYSYQRYLDNQIREIFGLEGTPTRFVIRERDKK